MTKNSFVAEVTFNDYVDLHMSSLGTLVREGPYVCFMQKVASLLSFHVFFTGTLITHTNTHSTLRGQ